MGIAVIGGLLIGTVLTLYVIPAVYTYLTGEKETVPTGAPERTKSVAAA